MRYFNYDDNEDFQDEVDSFFSDEEDELEEMMMLEEHEILAQIDLSHIDIHPRLLETARKICEKNIFWWFYSEANKMKRIAEVYGYLQFLVSGESDIEE